MQWNLNRLTTDALPHSLILMVVLPGHHRDILFK